MNIWGTSLYIVWALRGWDLEVILCVRVHILVWLDPVIPSTRGLSKQRQCLHSAVRVTGSTIPHAACLKSTLSKKALRAPFERQPIICTMMEEGKHMVFRSTAPSYRTSRGPPTENENLHYLLTLMLFQTLFFPSLVSVLTVTVHSDHICQATKKHYKSNVEVLVSYRMASKDVKYSTQVIWSNFMLIFGVW